MHTQIQDHYTIIARAFFQLPPRANQRLSRHVIGGPLKSSHLPLGSDWRTFRPDQVHRLPDTAEEQRRSRPPRLSDNANGSRRRGRAENRMRYARIAAFGGDFARLAGGILARRPGRSTDTPEIPCSR